MSRDKMNVMVRELSLGERMKWNYLVPHPRAPVLFSMAPSARCRKPEARARIFAPLHSSTDCDQLKVLHQDIEELCDRVIIIDHGKIFFDGPLNSIIDRFSGYKIISLTFQDSSARDFSALGEVIEQTPVSVQLKVPRAKVTETCRRVLEGCAVIDINVQELPVEEVIRQLFGERTTLRDAAEPRIQPAPNAER